MDGKTSKDPRGYCIARKTCKDGQVKEQLVFITSKVSPELLDNPTDELWFADYGLRSTHVSNQCVVVVYNLAGG